ncbi:hypothetical protein DPMN_096370 [Dreissena polymorpha]|uniref:Uncharacterized protein n=1 Tax=Dreissena polymorpha TaxID=45954 RepID=A0A9D4L886_DREPO|nr:hypothetical protein DPMN_096370 [Dreissena polymorpha]
MLGPNPPGPCRVPHGDVGFRRFIFHGLQLVQSFTIGPSEMARLAIDSKTKDSVMPVRLVVV